MCKGMPDGRLCIAMGDLICTNGMEPIVGQSTFINSE